METGKGILIYIIILKRDAFGINYQSINCFLNVPIESPGFTGLPRTIFLIRPNSLGCSPAFEQGKQERIIRDATFLP